MQQTSSDSTPDTTIIRTGSDGRLRYNLQQRQELLDAFDRSGLSAMAFSRHHGVCYQTFIAWLRKRRVHATLPPDSPAFAEVMMQQVTKNPSAPLRVVLPCGAVIEIASHAALPLAAELITTLRLPC